MSAPDPTDPLATPQAGVNPCLCPLCGQPNACAHHIEQTTGISQPPCWCTRITFSAELLARVPEPAQRKACICAGCAKTA